MPPVESAPRSKLRSLPWLVAVAILATGALLGFLAKDFASQPRLPTFKRLTFRRGTVWIARFAPDGQTVVYSAAWGTNPIDVFLTRPESPTSRPFGLKDTSLFGVSPTGELAVMLGAGTSARGYERFGTLARVPLTGGSPRPILENVRYADWSPDGKQLLVERAVGDKHRIEFPLGKVLYESASRIDNPRISPNGKTIAFFEIQGMGEMGGSRAVSLRVVDLGGKSRTLAEMSDWWYLAWSADGREIWYAAPEPGVPLGMIPLQAVSLSGKSRVLLRVPGIFELHDVARDGRVLFARTNITWSMEAAFPGESGLRDLTWLDRSQLCAVSPDGKTILFGEGAEGGGPNESIYVRNTDGSPATLIGEGVPRDLSPDGKWIVATLPTTPRSLALLPTGTRSPRPLSFEGLSGYAYVIFFPDGKHLLLEDSVAGGARRLFIGSTEDRKVRPIGPDSLRLPPFGNPISPDGRLVVAQDGQQRWFLVPADGGAPVPLSGVAADEIPIQWSTDARSLYIHRGGELPARVWRMEIASGRRELVKELAPRDPVGVTSIERILVTPDGQSFYYDYGHNLSDLYLAEGLK